jgi:hypothetical protein
MARPSTSDRIKLDRLRAARPKAVALKRGTKYDAKPMADLLAVNWPTLRDWIDAAPELEANAAVKRGGNGVPWEFKPLRTIDLLIKRFEASVDQQAARNRKVRQGAGINLPDTEDAASFAETKQMVDMTIAVVTARDKQGYYTPAAQVAAFIEAYNQRVTAAILGVRTQVDPNGNLPPHVRAEVDDYLRRVASHVHAEAAAFVKGLDAGLQQAGAS